MFFTRNPFFQEGFFVSSNAIRALVISPKVPLSIKRTSLSLPDNSSSPHRRHRSQIIPMFNKIAEIVTFFFCHHRSLTLPIQPGSLCCTSQITDTRRLPRPKNSRTLSQNFRLLYISTFMPHLLSVLELFKILFAPYGESWPKFNTRRRIPHSNPAVPSSTSYAVTLQNLLNSKEALALGRIHLHSRPASALLFGCDVQLIDFAALITYARNGVVVCKLLEFRHAPLVFAEIPP